MKKILFYDSGKASRSGSSGGSLYSLLEIVKILSNKYDIMIVLKYPHSIISEYQKLNIKTYVIFNVSELKLKLENEKKVLFSFLKLSDRLTNLKKEFFYLRSFFSKETWLLLKKINSFSPDIIHCNNRITSSLNLIILSRIYNIKCYIHQRQYDVFLPLIFKLVNKKLNFIAISKSINDNLISLGISNKNIMIIPNWIDNSKPIITKKSHLNNNDFHFIWIGRVVPWKGLDKVIELLNVFKDLFSCDFKLDVFGDLNDDSSYTSYINSLVKSYNLTSHINFKNYISNKNIDYSIYSVFFHSSIRPEPFGRSIIEAMQNNILVFSTALGGASEVIINKKNGIKIDFNSHIVTSNLLFNVLNDFKYYNTLTSSAAIDVKKKYSKNVIEKLIFKLY